MHRVRLVVAVIVMLSQAGATSLAFAQVPPHRPGSICFTPQFWCWANPPGPPGAACTCRTPFGPVQGTLG